MLISAGKAWGAPSATTEKNARPWQKAATKGVNSMTDVKHVECEKCGAEIGTENYVICHDGITSKQVTFHKRCQPLMSDVRQHHGATLGPVNFGLSIKDVR